MFPADNARGCAQSFFGAGSATTKDMIEWFLAIMAVHVDVQETMYQEILSAIGPDVRVSLNDKNRLPITESIIQEVFRFGTLIPLNIPHV